MVFFTNTIMPDTINIFIVYAREDKEIKHRLLAHLNPFVKPYRLVIWHDGYIEPGQEWKPHIESRLEQTDLFLLLVSVDFMNSEFINQVEFKYAIERHKAKKSVVIPVIINYCQWDVDFNFTDFEFNLNELQVLPQEGRPVDDWKTAEQAYNNIAAGVRKVLDSIKAGKPTAGKLDTQPAQAVLPQTGDIAPADTGGTAAGDTTAGTVQVLPAVEIPAVAGEDRYMYDTGTEPEITKPFYLRKKNLVLGLLALAALILVIYWSAGSNSAGVSSAENIKPDTNTVDITPVNNKSIDTVQARPAAHIAAKKVAGDAPAQKPPADPEDDEKIFSRVEVEASFPGGDDAWRSYLRKNLNAATPVDHGAKAGVYTVIVKFIVGRDGSLTGVACETDPGFGMCQEAMRVIKAGPKWTPAIQNGRNVNAYRRQPLSFMVEN